MGDAEAGEIALWTISTYVFDIWAFTPYQDVTSATKESGKTTLMECMALLMREPLVADNISPAAIYPAVAARKPTLLIDEGDTSLSKHSDSERIEAIRGVVNGGFRRTGNVVRCVGSQHEVAEFSTFCPKAFAGIGNFLSDTTRSRCVTIQLRKKRPSDRTEPFREHLYQPRSETLKREIAAWADSVDREALAKSYPATPDQLGARAADIWLPLLALADLAGGDWPARAHRAAITLSAGLDLDQEDERVQLLAAIRDVFDEYGTDAISSADLVERLAGDAESPWVRWWDEKNDRPKKAACRWLANDLRLFEIRSRDIRTSAGTRKGYRRESLEDAWDRHLSPSPGLSATSATTQQRCGFAPRPSASTRLLWRPRPRCLNRP